MKPLFACLLALAGFTALTGCETIDLDDDDDNPRVISTTTTQETTTRSRPRNVTVETQSVQSY